MIELAGWEWALIGLIVWWTLRKKPEAHPLLSAWIPAFIWIGLVALTGDHRLYFCYVMGSAVQVTCFRMPHGFRSALFAACAMIALFLAIRVVQGATLPVLIVEALVAAAILSVALALNGAEPHGKLWHAGIAAFGSVLALAGLAL